MFEPLMRLPDWLFYGMPALLYLLLTIWALWHVQGSASHSSFCGRRLALPCTCHRAQIVSSR